MTIYHTKLSSCEFQLTHKYFLHICNNFPFSWRPIYRFFQFTDSHPNFTNPFVSLNKLVNVIGKGKNIDMFWEVLRVMSCRGLVNETTFRISLQALALARDLKRCVVIFHLMNGFGFGYSLGSLNMELRLFVRGNLFDEARFFVFMLRDWIKPDGFTYRCLIEGFCDVGDLIEASKILNLMVDEGFEPDVTVRLAAGSQPKVRLKMYLEMGFADGGPWRRLCALPVFWVPKNGLKMPFRDVYHQHIAEDVLKWAKDGLDKRGFKETRFLNAVNEVVRTCVAPAKNLLTRYHEEWGQNVDPIFKELLY